MRVIVADDSLLLREGLVLLLTEEDHEVIAAVGTGTELVRCALQARPDLIIADIRMPPSHTDEGLRAAIEIRASWPEAPILLLSQYVVADYVHDLFGAGDYGFGYLLKDRISDLSSFLDALTRVASGGVVIDPAVVTQVMGRSRTKSPVEVLTSREREVLELMAEGQTNAAIAQRLFITEGAVEKHSQRIFAKLGLLPDPAIHRRVKAVLTLLQGQVSQT